MARTLWRIVSWCLAAALVSAGILTTARQFRWEGALPWLSEVALPLALLTSGAVLATINITVRVMQRRHARDLRRQIRGNLTAGTFRQIDAKRLLPYLKRRSVWAWQQYARLGSWKLVDDRLAIAELKRAAASGAIITTGRLSGSLDPSIIDGRDWGECIVETSYPGGMQIRRRWSFSGPQFSYYQVCVALADIRPVWPRASLTRRVLTEAWVWFKR